MVKLLDRRNSDKTITYLNRENLSKEVGDAYKIFCDQTARFLHQHDEKFFKIFKDSIRCEVKNIAKNEKKAELHEKGLDNKFIDKGENDPATKKSPSTQKIDPKPQETKLEEVEASKPEEEESEKQEENPEVEEYANDRLEDFKDNFTRNNPDLFKFMIEIIKQKIITKGDRKGQKTYSPAQTFCKELVKNLENEDMKAYLATLVRNCSFWGKSNDFKKLPVIYPQCIRGSKEQIKTVKIDSRGFNYVSNPIRDIAKVKFKKEDQKNKKTKDRGRIIKGGSIYKGLRLDNGFEACHIWYDTTKAPPLFTFIPNVVWLPQIIGRLSDKVVENKFFPLLLKDLSNRIYKIGKAQKLLEPIVAGCKLGLEGNGEVKSEEEEKIEPQYLVEKNNCGYFSYGNLFVKTKKRIRGTLDFIEKYEKIPKKTEEEPSVEELPEETLKSPMEEWIKEYEEEKKEFGSSSKALNKEGKETGAFRKWLENNIYFEDPSRPKKEKFEHWFKRKKEQKKPEKKAQGSYKDELKKMIIESQDAIFDLKKWLTHYYNSIIQIKDKEQFLKALKSGKDLSKEFQLTEEEINKNIEEIFGEKSPKNIESAQKYLPDEKVSSVLTATEDIPEEKSQTGKKPKQPSKEEEHKQKDQQEMDDFKMFVKALCNRQGLATKDYNKKKGTSIKN